MAVQMLFEIALCRFKKRNLRMMYLKYRYQLGYEVLVKEVSDSFAWGRFCHLSSWTTMFLTALP